MRRLVIKTFITLLIIQTNSVYGSATDFEVDGIYYKVTSNNTVMVMPETYMPEGGSTISIGFTNAYEGDVIIPRQVENEGKTYIVSAATDGAFRSSHFLTSISIPNTLTQLGGSPFASCSNLTEIKVDAGNPAYTSQDGVLYDASCSTIISCPGAMKGKFSVPSSVTAVADSAFQGCSSISEIVLPSGVKKIGAYSFDGCTSLRSINLPEGLKEIGDGTFQRCRQLSGIEIPNTVQRIGKRAFYYCI